MESSIRGPEFTADELGQSCVRGIVDTVLCERFSDLPGAPADPGILKDRDRQGVKQFLGRPAGSGDLLHVSHGRSAEHSRYKGTRELSQIGSLASAFSTADRAATR